jgi:hypothetical protein
LKNDDSDILFKRIKNVALRNPDRDEEFIEMVMGDTSSCTFHHVCSSVHGLKSTDYLGVAVNAEEHNAKQPERDWLIQWIPQAIENMIKYILYLKAKNKKLLVRIKELEKIIYKQN